MSLQALTGVSTYHTIRVMGLYNKKALQILLDSGSTHNFLDLTMARKLGCKLEEVKPMAITSGGGHKLEAPYVCKGFVWTMHNHEFSADMIVLPLVCCYLILGIQWLKSLGPILWVFEKLLMEFSVQGRKIQLRCARPSSVKIINNKTLTLFSPTAAVHTSVHCAYLHCLQFRYS